MFKNILILCAFVVFAGVTFLISCSGNAPTNPSTTITIVTISPATTTIVKGQTQQFIADVEGTNNPPQTVTWAIAGNTNSATSIDSNGLLTVVANETATTLTVTATSTYDSSKSGIATVTVSDFPPTVTSVTIIPANVSLSIGGEQIFEAVVIGTYNPPQSVTWEVGGGGAGTSINAGGLLKIGNTETATTLTIVATSTYDTSQSGTATVSLQAVGNSYEVVDTATWNTAVNGIRNGGDNKLHTIHLASSIVIPISTESTFGTATGITVKITGTATISIQNNSAGNLLKVGKDQRIVVEDVVFRGHNSNNTALISIEGGHFEMGGNASVEDNRGGGVGGGIYINSMSMNPVAFNSVSFTMRDNASVKNNTASSQGGGICMLGLNGMGVTSVFIMEGNASISNNRVSGGGSSRGGGLYLSGTPLIMRGSPKIQNNTASAGSGLYNAEGGGVYLSSETIDMEGGTISDNTATASSLGEARGGGMYLTMGASMQNGTIINNIANGSEIVRGGGVFVESGSFTMHNGTISNNSAIAIVTATSSGAFAYGGGVYGNLIMYNGIITENKAISGRTWWGTGEVNGYGGGVYGTLSMYGGTISFNSIAPSENNIGRNINFYGGGVYIPFSSIFTKNDGFIYGNATGQNSRNVVINGKGHAAYKGSFSSPQWRNMEIGSNDNPDDYGFWLNEEDITYIVVHDNWPPTSLTFTFSDDPGTMHASNITFGSNVSSAGASLSGNGTTRTLSPVSISGNGVVNVSILSVYGVETTQKILNLVPPAPIGLIAQPSASTVRIDWNQVALTTGYRVYRSESATGNFSLIGTVSSNIFVDTERSKNTSYFYRIAAYNAAGESPITQISATTLTDNTSRAIAVSSSSIVVEWPRDATLDAVLRTHNTAWDMFSALIQAPGGFGLRYSYILYLDNGFLSEIEVPERPGLTFGWPPITYVQDSALVNFYFISTGLSQNTSYNYKVAVRLYLNFGILETQIVEEEIMNVSATTFQ